MEETVNDDRDDDRDEEFKHRLNEYERRLLIALHFEPRVPPMIVKPHIDSIQFMCDKTLEDFLGTEHYEYYMDRINVKIKQREDRQYNQLRQRFREESKRKSRKLYDSRKKRTKFRVRKGTEQALLRGRSTHSHNLLGRRRSSLSGMPPGLKQQAGLVSAQLLQSKHNPKNKLNINVF